MLHMCVYITYNNSPYISADKCFHIHDIFQHDVHVTDRLNKQVHFAGI